MKNLTVSRYPSYIGFRDLFDLLESGFETDRYPLHNMLKIGQNEYRIEIALAGFKKEDLSISVERDWLVVSGSAPDREEDASFLHRDISHRSFTKKWKLASNVEVGDVSFENGLLKIKLTSVTPEKDLPRQIPIL